MSFMTNGRVPSISDIRWALDEIPGALRDEPLPEDVREDSDRAIQIWNPDAGGGDDAPMQTISEASDTEDDSEGLRDGPGVIFEVPPDLTDAKILEIMGEEESGKRKRLEKVRGIDALGWYVTFHQRRYQHGIYIPIEGVLLMAAGALADLPVEPERKIELAFHAIFRHELFHFAADCMAANWELTSGRDVYWKAKAAYRNAAGYIEQEEALANAYLLRGFKWPTRLTKATGAYVALAEYCAKLPAGYDRGPDYARDPRQYVAHCQSLSADFQHASVSEPDWPVPRELDTRLLYPDITRIAWGRCPIFILDELDLRRRLGITVDLFQSIDTVAETPEFEKDLRRLEKPIRDKWFKCKGLMARSTDLSGLDFKRWKPGGEDCYSVRVDRKYRAHLEYARSQKTWSAIHIGDHQKMKHG